MNEYCEITGMHATMDELLEAVVFMLSLSRLYTRDLHITFQHPCGGGVEYLHHDPASRRRRRIG
jgi:hypothetical protein